MLERRCDRAGARAGFERAEAAKSQVLRVRLAIVWRVVHDQYERRLRHLPPLRSSLTERHSRVKLTRTERELVRADVFGSTTEGVTRFPAGLPSAPAHPPRV